MTEWYIKTNGKKHGPFTAEQLKQLAASGDITPDDQIWREGLEGWFSASKAKELEFPAPKAPNEFVKKPSTVFEDTSGDFLETFVEQEDSLDTVSSSPNPDWQNIEPGVAPQSGASSVSTQKQVSGAKSHCGKCGAPIQSHHKCCPVCGHVRGVEMASDASLKICPLCKKEIDKQAELCPYCKSQQLDTVMGKIFVVILFVLFLWIYLSF